MSKRTSWVFVLLLIGMAVLLSPDAAQAYGGPGSIVSGIGALFAVVAAIFASIFGFIWFPIKRLIRKIRGSRARAEVPAAETPSRESE